MDNGIPTNQIQLIKWKNSTHTTETDSRRDGKYEQIHNKVRTRIRNQAVSTKEAQLASRMKSTEY